MRTAVILAGGSGTRLWPASRRARPKQFLALGDAPGESLIAATARRLRASCEAGGVFVVTAIDQAAQVADALPGLPKDRILAEPLAKNTAAAIGLACIHILARDPDATLGIFPADHHIADESQFSSLVERSMTLCEDSGDIVTLGIVPTRAETGFGYLELAAAEADGSHRVTRFVEKPDAATAATYVAAGNYLWNAGMFFARADRMLAAIERHLPDTFAALAAIRTALAAGHDEIAAETARAYPTLAAISIDHGVMEPVGKAGGLRTLPAEVGWNDVGAWSALAGFRHPDADENIITGDAIAEDARGNIIFAGDGHAVAVIGASDLVVVTAGGATLVVPKNRAQQVKRAVDLLAARGLTHYL
ncbi:MAG TPA: sugar phosphate nucleotidyltransferase [Kofleriaceae bacterium]|nr:sugar phosphate nucleotidyltransferase [Kofleriaceae bacterium]